MENDSFAKLPLEKQNQILGIAAEEFARCGYAKASTNAITGRAGISKGILFHYFGSKQGLYLHVLGGTVERFAAEARRQTEGIAGDSLYDSMAALFRYKAAYLSRYPLDIELMERAHQEQSEEVRADIRSLLGTLAATLQRQRTELARRSIDGARLRDGVTAEQALDCILMSLDALDGRFAALYKRLGMALFTKPEIILDRMRLYLDVVCRGLLAGNDPKI